MGYCIYDSVLAVIRTLRYLSSVYTFDQHQRGPATGREGKMVARHTVKGHGEELHPCVRD